MGAFLIIMCENISNLHVRYKKINKTDNLPAPFEQLIITSLFYNFVGKCDLIGKQMVLRT